MSIVSSMCQSVNTPGKIAIQNVGCFFTFFCGGHKNNLRLQFRSSFKNDVVNETEFDMSVKQLL